MKSRISQTFRWGFQFLPTLTSPKTDVSVKAYGPDSGIPMLDTGEDVFDISLKIESEGQRLHISLFPDRYRVLPWGVTFDMFEIADRLERASAQGLLVLPERANRVRVPGELLQLLKFDLVRKKRERFGDMAIRIALGIYEVFGLTPPDARRYVNDFAYIEEKEVLYRGIWYSYPDYLCRKHRLG